MVCIETKYFDTPIQTHFYHFAVEWHSIGLKNFTDALNTRSNYRNRIERVLLVNENDVSVAARW